jgi:hypothetical protein
MKKKYVYCFLGFLLTTSLWSNEVIKYRGEAYDLKTGKYLYSENHEEISKNGNPVTSTVYYKDENEKVIAKKTVFYEKSVIAPSYALEDFRDGYKEGAKYDEDGKLVLFTQKNSKSSLRQTKISPKQPIVMDQGFDKFIQKKWNELQSGGVVYFQLPSPSQQDVFAFRVSKISKEKFLNKESYLFKVEIDNALFRLVLKPIRLYYDAETKKLLGYIGVSNINDENGKSYNAKILFR